MVELVPAGDSDVEGRVTLIQGPDHVRIIGNIHGLEEGPHGFHIHTNGDIGDNCKAAGGHFNPDDVRIIFRFFQINPISHLLLLLLQPK